MTSSSRYPVPASTRRVEDEIKRSRFIATIGRAETAAAAAEFVESVSSEFPDATHNCWAFVLGAPASTDRIGMSDAGEPHGTAGRPMLNVLLHSGVGDIVAVVTRYFGGTKLGTGGLVRAYSGVVQRALSTLPLAERVELVPLSLTVEYSKVTAMQQVFQAHEVTVLDQTFGTDVSYKLQLPSSSLDQFKAAVLDATRGQARFS